MPSLQSDYDRIHRPPTHLPVWLYEALPFVYAVAGLMTIFSIGNLIAVASGGLLLSAAALVAYMRIEHRYLPPAERGCGIPGRSSGGRMPAWLYEPLPFLYVAIGMVLPVKLASFPGLVASAMLISAGVVVLSRRRRHRRAVHRLRRRSGAAIDRSLE